MFLSWKKTTENKNKNLIKQVNKETVYYLKENKTK